MSKWDGLNRRKFPRINFPCLLSIGGTQRETAILTHTENLGVGGVCVIIKEDIKTFFPVKVELDLMDMGDHIKCTGKVVWNVRRAEKSHKKMFHDIGIEFPFRRAGLLRRDTFHGRAVHQFDDFGRSASCKPARFIARSCGEFGRYEWREFLRIFL